MIFFFFTILLLLAHNKNFLTLQNHIDKKINQKKKIIKIHKNKNKKRGHHIDGRAPVDKDIHEALDALAEKHSVKKTKTFNANRFFFLFLFFLIIFKDFNFFFFQIFIKALVI